MGRCEGVTTDTEEEAFWYSSMCGSNDITTLPQSEKMMNITMRLKGVRANHLSGHKMSRVLNRFQLAFAIQLC